MRFSNFDIHTPGDQPDALVAMNPAALKVNLEDVKPGGLIIVDTGAFTDKNLRKAGYETNPLEDDTLANYRVFKVDMSRLTVESVKEFGLSNKEALRSKNLWSLGLVYWLFGRTRAQTVDRNNFV